MNIVNVSGGLGNQLFHYAFSKYLGDAKLEIGYYKSEDNNGRIFAHREFELPKFTDDYTVATKKDKVKQMIREHQYQWGKKYKDTLFDGCWQKTDYLKGLDLKLELKPEYISDEARELAEQMHNENSVAVHVRKTDYTQFGWLLDQKYYEDAVIKMRNKIGPCRYYVFSDNIHWCKLNLHVPSEDYIHFDTVQDLWLMSQCKHNIIANSTFSFWAAYLNKNNDKVVIYPKEWICADVVNSDIGWIGV